MVVFIILSLHTYYGITTEVSRKPMFNDYNIELYIINKTKYYYEVTYWVKFIEISYDEFLVDEPILINVTGYIDFHPLGSGNLPNFKKYIIVKLNFLDIPKNKTKKYIRNKLLKAIRVHDTRFKFSWKDTLIFESSGPKRMYIEVVIPTQNEIIFFKPINYIDIAPAYITTELKIMKFTIILTLWVIYLTILQLLRIFKVL